MKKRMKKGFLRTLMLWVGCPLLMGSVSSCIEPPLHLPAEEVLVDVPLVQVDMDVVWNLDIDWKTQWFYGWDAIDSQLWDRIDYPEPTNFEVRRFFLGEKPGQPHTTVDGFTIFGHSFRRTYQFGYYDMLLWSNIDSKEGTQVLTIDEHDPQEYQATTTITHGMTRVSSLTESDSFNIVTGTEGDHSMVTGLFNQPEIFYATYPRDIYISRFKEDYDYFDEKENCWVKRINCVMVPRVYIYLVQVIIKNNQNGRIKGTSGDTALSNMSAGTSVNTGHTWNMPITMYFASRMKNDIAYEGQLVDIIGGKFTTFGLCDLPPYDSHPGPEYDGSRTDLNNNLYLELVFSNNQKLTLQVDVTEQVRKQSHGGLITVVLDANDIPDPVNPDPGVGSLFVPTVEDYDEITYDIIM